MLGQECLLPRAAAFRASSQTLLVACAGIDRVVELDTRGPDPSRLDLRRFEVPAGPLGLALDPSGERAVVWSQFAGTVSIIDLAESAQGKVSHVKVSYSPAPPIAETNRGR